MTCKFKLPRIGHNWTEKEMPFMTLTCEELRKSIDEMKFRFSKINKSQEVEKISGKKDIAYVRYADELDKALESCKCEGKKDAPKHTLVV